MRHRLVLLTLLSGLAVAAEPISRAEPVPLQPRPEPIAVEPVPDGRVHVFELTLRPFLIGAVRFGTSARVDHGVERQRDEGDIVDGSLVVGGKLADHLVALHVGTDANAAEAGKVDAGLSYNHADYRDLVAVHDLSLAAGWSGERHWVIDGDLLVGPLHVAAGREDGVRTLRLGGGLGVRLAKALIRFTCDRLIMYTEDDDARALATETVLQVGVRATRHLLVQISGGYTHDALTSRGEDGVWEAALSLGFGF